MLAYLTGAQSECQWLFSLKTAIEHFTIFECTLWIEDIFYKFKVENTSKSTQLG